MSMEDGLQGNPNYYTRKKTVAHMSSIAVSFFVQCKTYLYDGKEYVSNRHKIIENVIFCSV